MARIAPRSGMPHGSTSLTPHIVVTPAGAAMEFYRDVFGARIVDVARIVASGTWCGVVRG